MQANDCGHMMCHALIPQTIIVSGMNDAIERKNERYEHTGDRFLHAFVLKSFLANLANY